MVKMELLPNELKKVFEDFPLYSQDGKGKAATVVCKFFNPAGRGTWYVLEGQQQEEDFLFFGYIHIFEGEFGYFTLSQIEEIELPVKIEGIGSATIKMERDLYFPIAEKILSEALKEDCLE